MVVADWIAIGIVVVCLAIGALIGFGKGLKFFTSGIFGIIIGVVVCALIGTVFLNVGFIGDFVAKFPWEWLGIVVYYIILFIIVQLLRIIIVLILKHVMEIDNVVMKVINRTLGAVFFLAVGVLLSLLVLKIIGWVGGDTAENLYNSLVGSAFRLDKLFEWITNIDFGITMPEIPEIPGVTG
ncbi:MAG: hypothetical protein K2N30_00595 [Clostridia bacterium]|nr:hypothetical protein [Clostridia bacterium]